MKTSKPALRALTGALLVALSGCASIAQFANKPSGQHGDLYDPQSKLIQEAGRDSGGTADQALARGDELLSQGDVDRAMFEYIKAIEKDDSKAEAFYKIGAIHLARGNLPLAQTAFQKTLDRSANHAGALEGHGLMLLQQRQHGKAKQYLEQALARDPNRWQAHNGLGVIADLARQFPAAAAHYQQALRIKPDQPMVLNNLGYSHYLRGDKESAQQYLEQAIRYDPRYQRAWENLGLVYTRGGDYPAAKAAFMQSMTEPQALNNIGYISMLEGQCDKAEGFFRQAIDLSPSYYTVAHENLKRCLASN
jgi:Flp pilus assembly protein TadD